MAKEVKILTTDNLADIKEKAKNSIYENINENFDSFSAENPYIDPPLTNYIPIQTISFEAGELSPEFIYYEDEAMYNPETYKAWVSVGDPKSSEDPLICKTWGKYDFNKAVNRWPANSNVQTFSNKKNIKVTLYFHNTFGTRGPTGNTPDNAVNHAAEYIGETGNSDYLSNYMKFNPSTGVLEVRTTNIP